MRVLHVTTAFEPAVIYGGPSVVAAQQTTSLARRGHRVTLVSSNVMQLEPRRFIKPGAAKVNGVEVCYFPSRVLKPHFSFIVSRELSGWLQSNVDRFDVVHVHFAREWIPVRTAQISIARGVPTFLQPHGMLGRVDGVRGVVDRLWIRRILESATGVFSLQQHEDAEVRRIVPHARVLSVPNGIAPPSGGKGWIRDNLVDPTVLFLARLHPRKRVLTFIQMARILRDQGVSAQYRIVGPDGGDLERAERSVCELGLEDEITFVGSLERDKVADEYSNSGVYVLPAVNEPWPITVLEAMSLGLPTVVTDTCFIAQKLSDAGAALISSPEPESLALAVRQLLYDPRLAEKVSSAARRLVGTTMTLDRVAERLEKHYESARA